ncbi:MAG: SMC-Scp complex subunit ScpB [Oscillatoriales cyanobacterium]|nr:MAG: SMC-Scp complex subunit ScpB [Oscillatoriales cyanobacterium]
MAESLAAKLEAILYLKGEPLSISQLATIARCSRATTEDALLELIDDYAHRDSALEIIETTEGFVLQLRDRFQTMMNELVPAELGVGALRTLAAIALRGPLLQSDLVELRGSGAYQHVQELMELGFVKRHRSSEARSYEVQVTDKFHRCFEIESLSQLAPVAEPEKVSRSHPAGVTEPE